MQTKTCLWILAFLILAGCDSDSDDVNITNNYITEAPNVTPSEEQTPVGAFELKTEVETDFFALAKAVDSLDIYYSNTHSFHFDKDGYLVNGSGAPLLVYPVNPDGSTASISLSVSQPIKLDYDLGSPKATDKVSISLNLPADDNELPVEDFDNQDPLTFNHSTSVLVSDSIGENHLLTLYFIHTSLENNTWTLRVALDGNTQQPVTEQILDFASNGVLDINDDDLDGFTSTGNGVIENLSFPMVNGAEDLSLTLDFSGDTTSFTSNFEVTSLVQSGFYSDHLKELKIDSNGLITLSYVHQEDKLIGKVAMVKFASPYNLAPLGDSLWGETGDSGEAMAGEAETDNFGSFTPVLYDF